MTNNKNIKNKTAKVLNSFVTYNKLNTFVSNSVCVKSLTNVHNNIVKSYFKNTPHSALFLKLASKALRKSVALQLPLPKNNTPQELQAYNHYINACAVSNQMPNARVVHFQLSRFGYLYTLVQQAKKHTFSNMFQMLKKLNKVHLTAESFVVSNASHLISVDLFNKIKVALTSATLPTMERNVA